MKHKRDSNNRFFAPVHGDHGSPEYWIWVNMKRRCYNPHRKDYHRYGARGIRVCRKWKISYSNFLADMGRRPSASHQLERTENNLGYSPSNCVWATRTEQCNNRSTCRLLSFHGRTLSMTQWGRRLNILPGTVQMRMQRGWTVSRALSTPTAK